MNTYFEKTSANGCFYWYKIILTYDKSQIPVISYTGPSKPASWFVLCVTVFLYKNCHTKKVSVFSEINPIPPYFFSLKILPMERSTGSQNLKKIMDHTLGTIRFCLEKHAHLGHLFA